MKSSTPTAKITGSARNAVKITGQNCVIDSIGSVLVPFYDPRRPEAHALPTSAQSAAVEKARSTRTAVW
jgi:hypothetical protein